MSLITLGSFTASRNPGEMTLIRPDKPLAFRQTFSSVAYFSWPATIVGKVIELHWNLLPVADFTSLDSIYTTDAVVAFFPGEGTTSYNVQIVALDGKYLLQRTHRADVTLKLLILSVAS